MAISPTKIDGSQIDLETVVSSDSDNSTTIDSNGLLKTPKTSSVTGGSTVPVTSGGVYTALGNRTAIETDATPTAGSSNFMTSGSIYTALQNIDGGSGFDPILGQAFC